MNPGLAEQSDGQDNECDGEIDEDTCGVAALPPAEDCGCGCASAPAPSMAWMVLPLVGLLRRRK